MHAITVAAFMGLDIEEGKEKRLLVVNHPQPCAQSHSRKKQHKK